MKQYPSIPRSTGQSFFEFDADVFDKLDGSNLRFEWSKKKSWYKYGTRHRLFDESDRDFGRAIPLFHNTLASTLADIASKNRWESAIFYAEYWGEQSFAGLHAPSDQTMRLTLFDVAPYKHGLIGPTSFLRTFGKLDIPRYLGKMKWTRGLVERIRLGQVEGITFEGVVGKAGDGKSHDITMAKAKTQAWIDKVCAKFDPEDAEKIINS